MPKYSLNNYMFWRWFEVLLKQIRENRGFSQSELSKLTGVSLVTLKAYEQGVRDLDNAGLNNLLKLANALGVRLDSLLTDETLKEDFRKNLRKKVL